MRIIGGEYGGRKIKVKIPENVRPTTDLVRESMFNILHNLIDFDNLNVLDLFAGTGALGIECLSRGAGFVRFVEKNRKTSELLRSIAEDIKISREKYQITVNDAVKFLNKDSEPKQFFDLVFADPPYDADVYDSILLNLLNSSILSDDFIAVIEYRSSNNLVVPDDFEIINERIFGDTGFKIIEKKKA